MSEEREVLQIIQKAKSSAAIIVDLNEMDLTEIPKEIDQLSHLHILSLHNNQIRQIPKELAQRSQLQELYLYENQIQEIPGELGQLAELQVLDLSGNRIRRIPKEFALLTQLQTLYLYNNQIEEIPEELAQAIQLQILSLYNNRIQRIPGTLSLLAQLQQFDLSGNRIQQIPPELSKLSQLQRLDMSNNQIREIPPALSQLAQLQQLDLSGNQIERIPKELSGLPRLTQLNLSNNRIQEIPPELAHMTQLRQLDLSGNRIQQIPKELARLTQLHRLALDNNPLIFPPPEITAQGTKAILSFLREQSEDCRREWVSRMVLVGEGGVGKTCLLKGLRGEKFNPVEDSTEGIWIDELNLDHPTEPGVTMKLKTWDFGGQHIYHATHQFFLTERSLYVLVWNARVGYEQSKLEYWLKNVQAKAPESPILLVATHIDQHAPDLPLMELQKKFPKIVGQWQLSNSTGEGIAEFKKDLTGIVANPKYLPLMGEIWPKTWLDAADRFRSPEMREKKCVTPAAFEALAVESGVKKDDIFILARWLHELGDILYFQDVDELKNSVILNPQWVTQHIFQVLDSPEVMANFGVLSRECIDRLWNDLDGSHFDLFLNLMEQFDLSYKTHENRDISIVVEHLRYDPPNYEALWNQKSARPEIVMNFRLGQDLLPGIPTWFIARAHRFTTHTHWRLGGLFADEGQNHLGLIKAYPQERTIQIRVRGPYPQNFFALLKDTLDLTLKRYKGLQVQRTIPCPGHDGEPCSYEFSYEDVLEILKEASEQPLVQCQKKWKFFNARDLLAGLAPSTLELEEKPEQESLALEWSALRQREFLKTCDEAVCPRLFTLHADKKTGVKNILGRKLILQIFCEAPGQWHSLGEAGQYTITEPAKWLQTLAHHGQRIVKIAKYAVYAFKNLELDIGEMEEYLQLVEEISQNMPELDDLKEKRKVKKRKSASLFTKWAEGAELRALSILLNELDPAQKWGGLRKVSTPHGQTLWLCEEHAKVYR